MSIMKDFRDWQKKFFLGGALTKSIWRIVGNADTKIGTNSFTEEQLAFNETTSSSVHSIPGNPGITIIIPTAPKPPQKDPDPLLVENVKLEEDIEDLNMVEVFDNELESHYDQNNEFIKSEVDFKHGKISEEMTYYKVKVENENVRVRTHTGIVYQCPQEGCEFKTSIKSNLNRHRKKNHGMINDNRSTRIKDENGRSVYQCPEEGCTWKGVTKLRLEKHVKRIHVLLPPKVYECNQCEYKTTSKRNSIRHMKSHEGPTKDQPLPCDMCGKMFTSKTMLTNHLVMEHGMSTIPEHCTRCCQCKSIVEKDIMESHVCIKKNKCKECGEMFYNNREKTKHFAAMHSELLASSNCEICGKVFRGNESQLRQQMERHLKVHTQGDIECPQCGKKVRDIDSHIATMHTQDDEKRHKCSYCEKGFIKKQELRRHVRIHLDARKYPCRYGCSLRYNDSSNRNAHEKKKHGALHSRSDNPNF